MEFRLDKRAASRGVNVHRHLYSEVPISEETEAIVRRSGLPWLKLNIEFPWQAMLAEAEALKDEFVEARYPGQSGWRLLNLHGLASQEVEGYQHYGFSSEEECPYKWTEAGLACPETRRFFTETWPFALYYRVRFAKLMPGGWIEPHCDYADRHLGPVNFALSQPEGAELRMTEYGPVPYEPGSVFMLDVGAEHQANNNSSEERIHIICHGVWGPGMQELIQGSYRIQGGT